MKKLLLVSILLSFLLINKPIDAQARCATCNPGPDELAQMDLGSQESTPSLKDLRQRLLEKRELIRERIREKKATLAAQLEERRKLRIRAFFSQMTRRMEAAIKRLERLIERIESRLTRIETDDEDIDTAPVRDEVDDAKENLASASAALEDAKVSLEDILDAENPKEAFADVRNLIKGIKQQLIEIHQTLVHVIGDIKGLRVGQGEGEE